MEMTKKNCMTQGFAALIQHDPRTGLGFVRLALRSLETRGAEPSMAVGDPERNDIPARFEDEGRTVIFSINELAPKLYACRNETGGYTFMLADEY